MIPFVRSLRDSLRLRIVLAVFFVATAPLVLVFVWSQVDKNVPGKKWGDVRDAMDAATALLTSHDDPSAMRDELAGIAKKHHVRLRIFRGEIPLSDDDADSPVDAARPFERFFLGPVPDDSAREIDETFGPLETRQEVRAAMRGTPYIGCEFHTLLFCQAVRVIKGPDEPKIVIAQATSQRAVEPIYRLRRQLIRLGLVTLPISALLAFYAARRVTAPLQRLRVQALAHADSGTGRIALSHGRSDEVGDLAHAFNALLSALEQKRADHERFVADLVHELKNPVAAVRACAEQIAAKGAIEQERAERLARVLSDSSTKLDRVVSQFLELARAEAGMPNEERTRIDLVALVRALTESLRADVRSEGVDVTFEAQGVTSATCEGVASRLEAVFRELFDNALSFAGERGFVHVTIRVDHDASVPIFPCAIVSVKDSGPGIAPEDLPRVFDRFFTTRGGVRGTGLGLALVKAVAEAHGGHVRVTTDAGSEFSVILPVLAHG